MAQQKLTHFVPFAYGAEDTAIIRQSYASVGIVRAPLSAITEGIGELPEGTKLWVDGEFDGFVGGNPESRWMDFIANIPGHADLLAAIDNKNLTKNSAETFVTSLLDLCKATGASFISVPQLPFQDKWTKKANKQLANLAGLWKAKSKYTGKLITPLILSHYSQYKPLTSRRQLAKHLQALYKDSGSSGVWIVDHSLQDQDCNGTNEDRFKAILSLHEQIKKLRKGTDLMVVGPYWGLNLISWTKEWATHAAIGVGRRFKYNTPGGFARKAKIRIAIPFLRRWCTMSADLEGWIKDAQAKAGADANAHYDLAQLLKHFGSYWSEIAARRQIASFYAAWIQDLADASEPERADRMHDHFSDAFKIGRKLPIIPNEEGQGRHPHRVAKMFLDVS